MNAIKSNWKLILITIGAIVAIIVMFILWSFSTENHAIKLEEQISTSESNINIQLKKRADSVGQLVQVVEDFARHEESIVSDVADARKNLQSGDVTEASRQINVIAEAYPEIKADATYINLMNQITINEQDIRNYRETYNSQVKEYRKYVRTFPHKQMLGTRGYEVIDYKNIEFNDEDLDKINENMFNREG